MADSNFGLGFELWQSFMPVRPRDQFNLYEQQVFNELSEAPSFGVNFYPGRPRPPPNEIQGPQQVAAPPQAIVGDF